MDEMISRAEHEEFAKRMESENQRLKDEDSRQNKRLEVLEKNVRETLSLAASVEKLATNMAGMVKIQEQQGKRLEILENRDGEMWRTIVKYALTAIVGGIITFALMKIGIGM